MGLMKSLRDSTKYVMFLLLFSFGALIFLEWGMDYAGSAVSGQENVGVVNGQPIRYQDIRSEYDQLIEMERQQRGGEIDEFTSRRLVRQVWDRRVSFMLQQQQVEKHNITISDAELIEAIRENPPDFVQQQEMFQTDGTFDKAKYLAALNNPNVQGWDLLELQFRAMLPQQKLINRITSLARVTDLEVRNTYLAQNERVRVKYLFFDPNEFAEDSLSVTDGELRAYYDDNKDDFEQDVRTRITYVKLEKKPSQTDEDRVKRQINDLYQRLQDGEDFEKLARDFSEDGSAENGGDLGFFGAGMMVKEFEETAFATGRGETAAPVKTMFGWHIIKVEDRKRENNELQVQARHILLKTTIGQQTLRELDKKATDLLEGARENGLEAAAAGFPEDSLEVLDTGYFNQRDDGFIPRIGYLIGASTFASKENVGIHSEVLENDTGYHILYIADRKDKGIQPFDEVETTVRAQVETDKRKELARQKAESTVNNLAGGSLDDLKGDGSIQIQEPEPFARNAFIPGIGQDLEFVTAAFTLESVGQMSEIVECSRGYYLLQLEEKFPIDEAMFDAQKEPLKQQLLLQEQNQIYTDWLESLKANADIVDRMGDFFVF